MLFPPASVIVPEEIWAIAPAVFPDSVTLCKFWVCTDCAATEMSTLCPVFEDTVTPPPTPVMETVPDVYVVFEAAIPPTKVCVSG